MADTLHSRGDVRLAVEAGVATVTFDRPEARNAMTFEMYRQLGEICDTLEARPGLRAIVFRGRGAAFVAPSARDRSLGCAIVGTTTVACRHAASPGPMYSIVLSL